MDILSSLAFLAVLFTSTIVSTSSGSPAKSSSSKALSPKETLIVTNSTQAFVRMVFEQYSRGNTSTRIAVSDFYSLLEALKIGEVYNFTTTNHVKENHDDEMDGGKRKERRTSKTCVQNTQNTSKNDATTHQQECHKNCIGKEQLLRLHHINKEKEINIDDFIQLCPSLLYEVQSGSCLHIEHIEEQDEHGTETMTLEAWLYGLAAITVISLSSLFAIALIPCLGKAIYNKVMSFLVALAVGTLAGDAFLHLIPHAFLKGIKHQEGQVNPVWKGVVIMAGIYLFLMVELFMKLRIAKSEKKQKEKKEKSHHEELPQPVPCKIIVDDLQPIVNHNHCVHSHYDADSRDTGLDSPCSANETELLSDLSQSDGIGYVNHKNEKWKMPEYAKDEHEGSSNNCSANDLRIIMNQRFDCGDSCHDVKQLSVKIKPCECDADLEPSGKSKETDTDHHHHHEHHHHHHGNKNISSSTSIATVAWMVIVGDGFHNFSDGLAVGAAFSSSITNGLTTAIAVLCHELPHELGDFAVLIKSGISFRQALAYNMASAIISFIGLIVGLALGNLDTSHVWVLAITSGLFLYISLVGMLPELSNYQAKDEGYSIFLLQNAGILTGIFIMLVIALLEKH